MIIRRHITSNFTIIPNEAILDARLSISARWLLAYLLSRPNDWQVQVGDIQKKGGIGREKAYRLIKELIAVGWVRKDFSRGEGGQWGGIDYVVMDQPEVEETSVSPCAEKPYTVKPHTENHHLTKNLKKPRTEKVTNTENNISLDAEFAEFWAAYPRRPGNSRKDALKAYGKARQKLKVPQEAILAGTKAYAAFREGEPPLYTKTAAAWLNAEMWACDWTRSEPASVTKAVKPDVQSASDADLDKLADAFPGHIGERSAAKRLLADELSKGTTLDALCEAARKYTLYCKGHPYEGHKIPPAMMETWLKFKWREMDGYEFCKVGPDQIRTVRPKKGTL